LNPRGADGRAGRRWARIEPLFRRRFPQLLVHSSSAQGDLTRIARSLARQGEPALLFAAGGDGTSHEVINGLVDPSRPCDPAVRMGWLPLGSGNDLARALGFGRSAREALAACDRLEPCAIDVGLIRFGTLDRAERTLAFGNSLTFGITAAVLRLVTRRGKSLGGLSYFMGAIRELLRYQPGGLAVTVDGATSAGPAWLLSVTNGPTFGAGMRITPDARLDDGRFDLIRITGSSRLELLSLLPRVYWGGHIGHRAVEQRTGAAITIETDGPVDFEADGELYSGRPPFRIEIVPAGLPAVRSVGAAGIGPASGQASR
jgi:diacylglycerol kinase (ATP)